MAYPENTEYPVCVNTDGYDGEGDQPRQVQSFLCPYNSNQMLMPDRYKLETHETNVLMETLVLFCVFVCLCMG